MAFTDLGDQFIALQKGRKQPADEGRHFGLVVDDKEAVRRALKLVVPHKSKGHCLTSATRGVTASRLLIMKVFGSRRRLMFSAGWVSII